jgi:hypothetical protein
MPATRVEKSSSGGRAGPCARGRAVHAAPREGPEGIMPLTTAEKRTNLRDPLPND